MYQQKCVVCSGVFGKTSVYFTQPQVWLGRVCIHCFDDGCWLGSDVLRFRGPRLRRSGVIPTLTGSTRTKCLSASWNVSGWSEIGLAFGIAHLGCAQNRGAYGLSGNPDLPIGAALPQRTVTPAAVLPHVGEFLLLPQPATAADSTSINANRPIFFKKSPFAETVNEIGRPCPQLDCWPCRDEASASAADDSALQHRPQVVQILCVDDAANILFALLIDCIVTE